MVTVSQCRMIFRPAPEDPRHNQHYKFRPSREIFSTPPGTLGICLRYATLRRASRLARDLRNFRLLPAPGRARKDHPERLRS
jgi:hypothetical protein